MRSVAERRLNELQKSKSLLRDREVDNRRLIYENEKLITEKESLLSSVAELRESIDVYKENFRLC
jgi:methyl-accepting chemotaxis protein